MTNNHKHPLAGIRVLDFSTLLPGPLATLILAEAGADVIKIERPGTGDEMRRFTPRLGSSSAPFAQLNFGKKSIVQDLKAADAFDRLTVELTRADILVEQFRPGVMERLGFGYEAVRALNPAIVYCSISGYGATGPAKDDAGHDLNYLARSGLLLLGADKAGRPVIPPGLIADIGGGALPAVMNILLALRQAEATGEGAFLDIAMTDGLFAWSFWAQAETELSGAAPTPGGALLTGGSPRYQIYQTSDQAFLAAAPLEERFWKRFCKLIEAPDEVLSASVPDDVAIDLIAKIIAAKPASHWHALFVGEDVCACIAQSLEAVRDDPHFKERGLFNATLREGTHEFCASPVPLAPLYRPTKERTVSAPTLNQHGQE